MNHPTYAPVLHYKMDVQSCSGWLYGVWLHLQCLLCDSWAYGGVLAMRNLTDVYLTQNACAA